MNAQQLIKQLQEENPGRKFAVSDNGDTVGVEFHGVWVALYSKMLNGQWADAPHILVNGRPIERKWVPHDAA